MKKQPQFAYDSVEEWVTALRESTPVKRDILYLASPELSTLPELCRQIAYDHGVTVREIRSARQTHKVLRARNEFILTVWRALPDVKTKTLARFLNHADHTSVLHAIRKAGL